MKRAGRTVWIAAALVLVAAGLRGFAAPKRLTGDQELELKTLTGQLTDATRSAKTKAEAAELLLTRPYPEATAALKGFLADGTNRPAQIAVAEAVARHGVGSKDFVEPLLAMLTSAEATVREPAARALVTYNDDAVAARLVALARDRKADKAVRLVTISALQRVVNKQAIDALVQLVGERDAAIRSAAAESLAMLTNIRAFGDSATKWRRWWNRNKNKPASAWLADLADSLGREKARLQDENLKLRQRLATAMMDLYAATPAAQQDKLLLSFLKDPLADVRQVGVTLADRRVSGTGKMPDELRTQVRTMLADEDPGVRGATALLVANLGDPNAVADLLARLKVEETPEVKQGLLTGLGHFRSAEAVGPILSEVLSKDEPVAAAAAAALARAAGAQPLEAALHDQAIKTLLKRYRTTTASANGNGAALREALLTAMGMVADNQFIPALRGALTDTAATVRLAAVRGLAQLRRADLADTLAPLAADEDRGVRQAVIDALGTLSGPQHLQVVLQRTDPTAETDAAVREKAWSVVMTVLAKADATALAEVCELLADRKDAASQRIRVQQMLVQVLKADKSAKLPQAQRELAAALRTSSRPAEAVPLLAEAYAAYAAAKDPKAKDVYLDWIDAMLQANDPLVVKAMGDPARQDVFAEVVGRLSRRLTALVGEGRYGPAILLAGETVRQVPKGLTAAQRANLEKIAADARAKQLAEDRKQVAQLAAKLLAAEEAARKAASGQLKAMGDRAVQPLVMELRKLASAETPSAEAEKAILDILTQLAPKLTGYDIRAPRAERLSRIDAWLKVL